METEDYLALLTDACEQYEKTAPTVRDHCDDLFVRMNEKPFSVTLGELNRVSGLWRDGWMHPNYAANLIYKLRQELKMDTIGYTGF